MEQKNIIDLSSGQLVFDKACIVDNRLWFSSNYFNGLCYMNLQSHEIEYVDRIPNEAASVMNLYSDIKYCDGKLILTPLRAREIAVFDLSTNTFQKYALKEPKKYLKLEYLQSMKFCGSVVINHSVYFVGQRYPAIVELDLMSGNLFYYTDWADDIQPYLQYPRAYFRSNIEVDGTTLYAASFNSNIVLKFDTIAKRAEIKAGNDFTKSYSAITKVNDTFLLALNDIDGIDIWNCVTDNITELRHFPAGFQHSILNFYYSVNYKDCVYYLPAYSNMLLKMNKDTQELNCVKCYDSELNENNKGKIVICSAWIYEGKLWTLNNLTGKIEVFDENDSLVDSFYMNASCKFQKNMVKKVFDSSKVVAESDVLGLDAFLNYICSDTNRVVDRTVENNVDEVNVGSRIVSEIGKELEIV